MRTKFKYPPCAINPTTEKPYSRHAWEIISDEPVERNGLYYYRVRCKRQTCQINDPRPVAY